MATKAEFEQAAAEEPRDAEVIVVLEALIARLLLAEAIVLGVVLRRALPTPARGGHVHWACLRPLLRFSGGMAGTMLLGHTLNSLDQVILSAILPLAEFGYYTLAVGVAATLGLVVTPVTTAVYPRFSQLALRMRIRERAALSIEPCTAHREPEVRNRVPDPERDHPRVRGDPVVVRVLPPQVEHGERDRDRKAHRLFVALDRL
jgi:hypothetical protein